METMMTMILMILISQSKLEASDFFLNKKITAYRHDFFSKSAAKGKKSKKKKKTEDSEEYDEDDDDLDSLGDEFEEDEDFEDAMNEDAEKDEDDFGEEIKSKKSKKRSDLLIY